MRRQRGTRLGGARLGCTALAAAVLAVMLAAPAFGDPAATSWTVTPKSDLITYGDAVFLTGQVKSGGLYVPGLWVDFGQGTTQAGSFEVIYKITTPQAGESAKYTVGVKPLQTTYFRFQWAGDATYAASDSDVIPVQVAPALGSPVNGTTITVNKKFSVKGSVEPGAPGGPTVKLKSYRQKGDGSWAGYKTYATTISGTQYAHAVTITQTGKYKFKVVSVESQKYAAGASGFGKVLTVKQ